MISWNSAPSLIYTIILLKNSDEIIRIHRTIHINQIQRENRYNMCVIRHGIPTFNEISTDSYVRNAAKQSSSNRVAIED